MHCYDARPHPSLDPWPSAAGFASSGGRKRGAGVGPDCRRPRTPFPGASPSADPRMQRERMNVVMPEHARRFTAPPYDQFDDEDRVADWGGDDLFTRMPRPRAIDDAPPPRFSRITRSSPPVAAPGGAARTLSLVESPEERRVDARLGPGDAPLEERSGVRDRRRAPQSAERAMLERAERLGLAIVPPSASGSAPPLGSTPPSASTPPPAAARPAPINLPRLPDGAAALPAPGQPGRATSVIIGRPDRTPSPHPLPIVRADRQRHTRTPAEWIGARPERIVGWAFALGLLLILIAISTADAAAV